MKLAGHLHRTEAETKETVDSQEFARWMAMYEIDPWGEDRIELAIAKGNAARFGGHLDTWVHAPPEPEQDRKALGIKIFDSFKLAVMSAEALKGKP